MRWARYVMTVVGGALILLVAVVSAIVIIDPYDTGRFGALGSGTPAYGQRMADASRARNPAFDSAIIGNSTIQLIDPARLDAMTGDHFVSLAIPGTGPYEQLVVLDWFLRHHRDNVRTIVIGLDAGWCDAPRRFGPDGVTYPFPFWLYGHSRLEYLAHMGSYKSVEAAARRVAMLLGHGKAARANGYNDYEVGRTFDVRAAEKRIAAARAAESDAGADEAETAHDPTLDPTRAAQAPAFNRLASIQRGLPSGTRLILVFPPREAQSLPPAGSEAADAIASCKAAAHALAAAPGVRVIDFLHDDDLARTPENFWDSMHYRGTVARRIEAAIAERR